MNGSKPMLAQNQGVLLIGHGTRSILGTRQFLELVEHCSRRIAPTPLEPAFLEIQQPGIAPSIERLLTAGIQKLIVMPLLLFAAGHAKRDIPEAVSAALQARGRGDLPWLQAAHLGCHPAILELSRRRMAEVVGGQWSVVSGQWPEARSLEPSSGRDETCLLLVGRGSPDESATAEMQEFARLRQQQEGGMPTEVAFLAMARPLLEERLRQLAAVNYKRVIVQPHLLFAGELADSLRQQVEAVAFAHPKTEWVVTPLLADALGEVGVGTELLVEAMVARCLERASEF